MQDLAESQKLVTELLMRVSALTDKVATLAEQVTESKNKKDANADESISKSNHKDIEKPVKFDGDKFATWGPDFKNVLSRIDSRWRKFLDVIKGNSRKPLEDEVLENVMEETGSRARRSFRATP